MPDKGINRNVNKNRIFGNEAYRSENKFHKRDLRLNKGIVSGMAKEKGITTIESSIGGLPNAKRHCLRLLHRHIILVATRNCRKHQNSQG